MPNPSIPTALMMLLAAPSAKEAARVPQPGVVTGRITVQRIVIRIPAIPSNRQPAITAPPAARYAEKKGPKCVAVDLVAGSAITRSDSIDLMMMDGRRLRAKLGDECPALDFYAGFYLKPSQDGMLCADRDSVRSRAGDECGIDAFKKLVAKR